MQSLQKQWGTRWAQHFWSPGLWLRWWRWWQRRKCDIFFNRLRFGFGSLNMPSKQVQVKESLLPYCRQCLQQTRVSEKVYCCWIAVQRVWLIVSGQSSLKTPHKNFTEYCSIGWFYRLNLKLPFQNHFHTFLRDHVTQQNDLLLQEKAKGINFCLQIPHYFKSNHWFHPLLFSTSVLFWCQVELSKHL